MLEEAVKTVSSSLVLEKPALLQGCALREQCPAGAGLGLHPRCGCQRLRIQLEKMSVLRSVRNKNS